ncbi:MAG: glucose-6-phosphate isomerase [Acidimicrobiaceae bacterium]|nr:glucose-6-phosphate isomerase [Acidimicrobiaceae bacterium]
MDIAGTSEWGTVSALAETFDDLGLRRLFADDAGRVERLSFSVGDLLVDLSKHRVTEEVLVALVALAQRAGLDRRVQSMMQGERINSTEDRAVLHTALRAPAGTVIEVDGDLGGRVDVVAAVHSMRKRMAVFCERVRDGDWVGDTGAPIETVVNIGIGGSDLGPSMAYEALAAYRDERLRCRFVSNVDSSDLVTALSDLDPATTLFVVASKTFTTSETLANAVSARRWLTDALGDDAVARHFVAVSTNRAAVTEFGIDAANMFEMWDWVGGRYSLDSAIGLSLMAAVGPERFEEMLSGMRIIDEHFAAEPLSGNVPVLAGLIAVWYRTFCGLPTRAVLPYSQALRRFTTYLQQLDMESNGKRVRLDGEPVDYQTGPIVWGEPGTNGQHSFHQLLHQGTTVVPCDFIVFANPDSGDSDEATGAEATRHHELLAANCLAQAEALAFGRTAEEVAVSGIDPGLAPHRTFPGNRPSTTIMAPRLTPSVLGQLIAFYEHQTLTQGVVWGINPFDQWGVELGKSLAAAIAPELGAPEPPTLAHDPSTNALITRYRELTGRSGGPGA